jgi:hypothetical protein
VRGGTPKQKAATPKNREKALEDKTIESDIERVRSMANRLKVPDR